MDNGDKGRARVEVENSGPRRRRRRIGLLLTGVLAMVVGGAWWTLYGPGYDQVVQAETAPQLTVSRERLLQPPPVSSVDEPPGDRPFVGPPAPEAVTEPRDEGPPTPDAAAEAPSRLAPPPTDPVPSYGGPRAPEHAGSRAPAGTGLVDGMVFGRQLYGVHPELLRRLRAAEVLAAHEAGGQATAAGTDLGVDTLVGYRTGSRSHVHGLAVDFNYYANPYLMHERGEEALDRRLAPVYHRIARLMLGRDSVIPDQITRGTHDPERTMRLFSQLREESRAMIGYFRLMPDRAKLQQHLSAAGSTETATLLAAGAAVTPEALQRQMLQDYVTLSGRSGPPVPGMSYPPPETVPGDPPFAGDSKYRSPELGFMNLNEELVRALAREGVRWGATDMGPASGDLMHFYLPASEVNAPLPRPGAAR